MDTTIITRVDAAKTASKRVVQKTAKAIGDFIGNKIADKISSVGNTKSKEKEHETNKRQEIYIPPEKRQQIINDIRLFQIQYKNEIPKNYKSARSTSDNAPRFNTEKQIEVHHQPGRIYNTNKLINFTIRFM